MGRPKTNIKKDKVTLYLNSKKIEKARRAALEMGVPLSFIIEDILSSFLDSFEDDFPDDDDSDELTLEDYYKWKFKAQKESKVKIEKEKLKRHEGVEE